MLFPYLVIFHYINKTIVTCEKTLLVRGALTTSFCCRLRTSEYEEIQDKKTLVIGQSIWQECFPSIIAGKIYRHKIGHSYFFPKGQRLRLFEDYVHIITKAKLLALVGTPIISRLPESIKMVQGIRMKCEGEGRPPVQVMWMKGSVMLASGTGSAEYTFQKGDTSGNYTCIATNKEGTTNMTVEVTVLGRYTLFYIVIFQL